MRICEQVLFPVNPAGSVEMVCSGESVPFSGSIGVRGHAAPLLVREVDDVEERVEGQGARPQVLFRTMVGRVVGRQAAGLRVESELVDPVRSPVRDVRNIGEPVRSVRQNRVRAVRRVLPLDGRKGRHAVVVDRVHRRRALVVVGREHEAPGPVGRHVHGLALQRRRAEKRQAPGTLVDPVAGDLLAPPAADIEHALVGRERQRRRPALDRHVFLPAQRAAGGVHREDRDLVVVLERDVHVMRILPPAHLSPSCPETSR